MITVTLFVLHAQRALSAAGRMHLLGDSSRTLMIMDDRRRIAASNRVLAASGPMLTTVSVR